MMFILANDAHIARQWAERNDIPAEAWCNATAGKLRAFPDEEHADHKLVILEGAEMSPDYQTVFGIAKDRRIAIDVVPMDANTAIPPKRVR